LSGNGGVPKYLAAEGVWKEIREVNIFLSQRLAVTKGWQYFHDIGAQYTYFSFNENVRRLVCQDTGEIRTVI
jgi:hypothetical protein